MIKDTPGQCTGYYRDMPENKECLRTGDHVCGKQDDGVPFSDADAEATHDGFEALDAFMAEKLDGYQIELDGFFVVLRTPESLRKEVCGK